MSFVVLAALCALAPGTTRLSATAPDPAALLLLTPTGEPGRVSRSEALRAIEDALDEAASLRALTVSPNVNRDCRGRLPCIIEALDITARNTGWLLVVTQITLEGEPDRVTPVLVRTGELGTRPTEDEVEAQSRRGQASWVTSPEQMRGALQEALVGPFKPLLDRQGQARTDGQILLEATEAGALVHLDDRPLGTTSEAPTLIERVRAGPHTLRLSLAGRSPWSAEVEVVTGERASLSPELAVPVEVKTGDRVGFLLAGAAVAVTGGVLVSVALGTADDSVRTACFENQPGCEAGTGFASFDYDASAEAPLGVNPRGIGPAQIGAALMTTGLGLGIGALLEDGDVPWWSLGLSLAAGGAVLGASVALDGGQLP